MNWKETFYTGKREHPQEKKPASLTALLMPSLLGTAICLVCLCSLTWAWFTATQNSGVQPIQSATATVTASLNNTALGELKVGEPCSLNGTGTLTLHMEGDAQYAYVVIKVGDTEYHTDYLTADGYTITVNESGAVLTLYWGEQDSLPGTAVENGGSVGTAQSSNTTDEQPAADDNNQQTPDAAVPGADDANTGSDDASTGDQASNGENTGSENGGSTDNGSGEQGSDSGTGSDAGAGGSTGGDAGNGDTSNGTGGTTGE